ncbi:MAG: 1,6-anhydro-N-acetylmuramyl-L-alanine amidase AmpD [Gammaproteobacteria bacterium]|jgi:N-acetyl-anhydromuramoyl-L-alanine amidase|nr:1,6-anhydro-N-acetylmuramyl-L-alanine amidase AmpD [Gammaproteobacteria bacterium]MBT5643723.1 1,6-anhydro-N-acetylmuramyl-L-alanine amidase AmpD [Gammaproteobacteria bacterium]MBT5862869.1 1,6-anhydro-N-acetylmuramyl-L-alanine amidase AmpD [Gammaproteobacteria bacterium]MBT6734557.1 1,6-anhydro-N-acetylmuramyl-L-alanine amidase AmpD [Gammaproteobacteria bacterium]MBT7236514.1 1,6-anhydro-N-acetylmuramyl-L-alanine amidase AmpD [Gammaproteobacteria bacterium]|tara:strand:+ start:5653 stop:6195 length:543 start_codon:yes stop_codon:yes gene_type:complete
MLKINTKLHLIEDISYLPSDNYDLRPDNIDIDTIIIHCISLPEGAYDNENVSDLFTNKLDIAKDKTFLSLKGLRVSSHLFIRRNGVLSQFVPFNMRAWHAGVSQYKGRENYNDFSIGIELEGTSSSIFTEEQYSKLREVIKIMKTCYPKIVENNIIGHNKVSPERKEDPGKFFEWDKIKG